jgi:hypothetical protein
LISSCDGVDSRLSNLLYSLSVDDILLNELVLFSNDGIFVVDVCKVTASCLNDNGVSFTFESSSILR